jgi:hypothetical protein
MPNFMTFTVFAGLDPAIHADLSLAETLRIAVRQHGPPGQARR